MYAIARKAPLALYFHWKLQYAFAVLQENVRALFAWEENAFAAQRADVNATAERLLDRYGNSILHLAYSYLHNMTDAEEIVQDTLVQFLKETPKFADETHKKAWCLRVAGNLAKNRIKYNQVRDADELNEELAAEKRDDLSFVWEAVKALPVKYREGGVDGRHCCRRPSSEPYVPY